MIKKAKVCLWGGEFTWVVFKPKACENKKQAIQKNYVTQSRLAGWEEKKETCLESLNEVNCSGLE